MTVCLVNGLSAKFVGPVFLQVRSFVLLAFLKLSPKKSEKNDKAPKTVTN